MGVSKMGWMNPQFIAIKYCGNWSSWDGMGYCQRCQKNTSIGWSFSSTRLVLKFYIPLYGDGSKPWYLLFTKIAGIYGCEHPTKNVSIGIDPYPYTHVISPWNSYGKSPGKVWLTSNFGEPPMTIIRLGNGNRETLCITQKMTPNIGQ